MGFVDLVVEASMNLWDIAALIPIVEGAGGRVTSWDGGPVGADGRVLAAGDPRLHEPALEILAQVGIDGGTRHGDARSPTSR